MAKTGVVVEARLKRLMDRHPEIDWSKVLRAARKGKANQLKLLNALTKSSKASDRDIKVLAARIKRGIAERH